MSYSVGAARAAVSVFWWWLVSAARCGIVSDPYSVMENVIRGVMADDINWKPVLITRIKLDKNRMEGNAEIEELLKEMDLADNTVIDVLPVIKRLVKNRSFTGSELKFGVHVLGSALSCKLSSTVLLHTFFAYSLAKNKYVDVPTIRSSISKIQSAVAKYTDKVAAFDQSVLFFHEYNDAVNLLFMHHDADRDKPLKDFVDALYNLVEMARQELRDRCDVMEERTIATTHRVTDYNDSLFNDLEHVDVHQLLTIIEDLEEYDYVDFVSGGPDFWKQTYRIVDYRVEDNMVENEKEDKDDE